ncbi:MAG: ribonuclease III [Oscillospiraceae bacterium]|nr:ribonuclease III [Oscillospiraceae bacterium]
MNDFEKIINYTFKDKSLLKQALTHSSFINSGGIANERMEFLGDSVLSVVVSKYLYDNLKSQPEGFLTKLRANLVCEDALYGYAKKIGLGQRIAMGKGEENTGGRDRKSILSDAFEALIAAVYLDSCGDNDDLEGVRGFIIPFLPNKASLKVIKPLPRDYKTALQELVQQNPSNTICYEQSGEAGSAHEKVFFADVLINGQVEGSGRGKSKKESQQQAAKAALIKRGAISPEQS